MAKDKVFLSYSHKDKKWRDELETHLKPYLRNGIITSWSDQQIEPGSQWLAEIESALTNSRIAVLLVSPDFLGSDFIHEHELGPLLKKAEQGGAKILWIPIRSSAYKQTPLNNYQAIIDPSKPLAGMSKAKRDQAWVEICERIQKGVNRTDESRQSSNLGQSNATREAHAVSPAGGILPFNSSQPALKWENHLRHSYEGVAPTIYTKAVELSASNVSDRSVQLEEAHFTSAITTARTDAKVVSSVGLLDASETTPILPGGPLTLRAEFNTPAGLPAQEFIKVWGKMVLHVKYDGVIHQVPIGEDMTRNLFTAFRPCPLEPTVTRATTKQNTEPPGPATFSSGQKLLAVVAAQVTAEEERLNAEAERLRQQIIFRAESAKKSWGIIRDNLERLWSKIRVSAPGAERLEKESVPSLHLRWGLAELEFAPINVVPNTFKQSGWDVLEGYYIRVSQIEPRYTWSANLWFLRLPDTEAFGWYEVSYFETLQSTRPAPFGVNSKDDYNNADLAASVVVGPWQVAFGPVPVDGEQEEPFHERWIERFAQAAVGKLRPPRIFPLQ